MKSNKLKDQSFLFASNRENPEVFFQGYCFVGTDYIFGDGGREKFYKEVGTEIKGGEDGCYVTVEKLEEQYNFSCDFSGNKKIFYYWTTELWVVSNSVYLIAEYLKKNNIKLRVNYSQLKAIGVHRGAFFNQLYSVDTFIKGIKLLPTGNSLKISTSGYTIDKLERTAAVSTYEDGLSYFIGTWVARFAGLMSNGIKIQSDLTGGADSRTVFALLKYAAELSESHQNLPSFRSGSTETNTTDLEIANIIGEKYGFPINERDFSIINRFSGEESYMSWKTLCLGVYHPIYFPSYGPQSHIVNLGGAGAENHRHFYKYEDTQSFIELYSSKIAPSWLSYNIVSDFEEELKRMSSIGSEIDPMILHYREYRNRMHSGRTPQYISLFNPLGSKLLEDVSEIAGADRLKAGQINYDLMATLLPSILAVPFDHPSKALNDIRSANLTVLESWKDLGIGKTYIDTDVSDSPADKTNKAMELLYNDFNEAKENKFVQEFFGAEFIEEANETIIKSVKNGKFPHAIDAQGIVAIIAAAIFD